MGIGVGTGHLVFKCVCDAIVICAEALINKFKKKKKVIIIKLNRNKVGGRGIGNSGGASITMPYRKRSMGGNNSVPYLAERGTGNDPCRRRTARRYSVTLPRVGEW